MEQKQVIFVCFAGVIRSQMAAAIFRKKAFEEGFQSKVNFQARGIEPNNSITGQKLSDLPWYSFTRQALAAIQVNDLPNEKVEVLDRVTIENTNLIIPVSFDIYARIGSLHRDQRSKIVLLSDLADNFGDVEDPAEFSLEKYIKTAQLISNMADIGFNPLLERLHLQESIEGNIWFNGENPKSGFPPERR